MSGLSRDPEPISNPREQQGPITPADRVKKLREAKSVIDLALEEAILAAQKEQESQAQLQKAADQPATVAPTVATPTVVAPAAITPPVVNTPPPPHVPPRRMVTQSRAMSDEEIEAEDQRYQHYN